MKRLHLYIIKSFIGPFFVTLLISLFVLLMQFLWVYLDELVGKGLDFSVILEFIVYTMAMLMTNALPLAMLLASIMTFGDLGENNELLAMKAAGISLYRIMKPVIVLSILLSIGSFYFYNQVIPVSYKKLIALMSSIRQLRPEIIVKEGVFSNEIDNYSIKVGRKTPNGEMLYDIMIYDHTEDNGNVTVTVADSGTMKITEDRVSIRLNQYLRGVASRRPSIRLIFVRYLNVRGSSKLNNVVLLQANMTRSVCMAVRCIFRRYASFPVCSLSIAHKAFPVTGSNR